MANCFLSVIVPVYNAEAYLAECLDSLLAQDCEDYEILCVNDGSTDKSPKILEEYQRRDPKVRVLHQANGGVTAARNAGLEAARGEFIWFVDADDFLQETCFAALRELAESGLWDRIVVGGYEFEDALSPAEQDQARRGTLSNRMCYQDSTACRNLLRRAFLQEHSLYFRYPELTHGEDGMFMYEVGNARPRTMETQAVLYFYRTHAGSAETSASLAHRQKKVRSHIRILEILLDYYHNRGRRDSDTADKLMAFLWMTLYELAQLPRQTAKKYLAQLHTLGLYPSRLLPECTQTRSYLVDISTAPGRALEFVCSRLHRPWAYETMRLLRWTQRFLGRVRGR